MTIFDIIRYPVIDIFDNEEIDKIPREIVMPWVNRIVSAAFSNAYFKCHKHSDFCLFISMAVTRSCLEPPYSCSVDSWKEEYTNILRKMIIEYEPQE